LHHSHKIVNARRRILKPSLGKETKKEDEEMIVVPENLQENIETLSEENEVLLREYENLMLNFRMNISDFSNQNSFLMKKLRQEEDIQNELKNKNLELSKVLLSKLDHVDLQIHEGTVFEPESQ
jgi:ribosomal protein L16 Arg81 hydroxylase